MVGLRVGHWVMVNQPEAFNQTVSDWQAATPPAQAQAPRQLDDRREAEGVCPVCRTSHFAMLAKSESQPARGLMSDRFHCDASNGRFVGA